MLHHLTCSLASCCTLRSLLPFLSTAACFNRQRLLSPASAPFLEFVLFSHCAASYMCIVGSKKILRETNFFPHEAKKKAAGSAAENPPRCSPAEQCPAWSGRSGRYPGKVQFPASHPEEESERSCLTVIEMFNGFGNSHNRGKGPRQN